MSSGQLPVPLIILDQTKTIQKKKILSASIRRRRYFSIVDRVTFSNSSLAVAHCIIIIDNGAFLSIFALAGYLISSTFGVSWSAIPTKIKYNVLEARQQ